MFTVELKTKEGRRFSLAPFGWSFTQDHDPRVTRYRSIADARRAMRNAYKAKGDKLHVARALENHPC